MLTLLVVTGPNVYYNAKHYANHANNHVNHQTDG